VGCLLLPPFKTSPYFEFFYQKLVKMGISLEKQGGVAELLKVNFEFCQFANQQLLVEN